MAEPSTEAKAAPSGARASRRLDGREPFSPGDLAAPGAFAVAMADAWGRMVVEGASFLAERMRADARTLSQAMTCKSPNELQDVQAAFVQKAVEDYQAEAGRMAALMEGAVRAASGRAPE